MTSGVHPVGESAFTAYDGEEGASPAPMNCLQCGKKVGVSFLRKVRDSRFCSEEHRLQFLAEQEQMALARLIETQVAKPVRKQPAEPEPPVCGFLTVSPGVVSAPSRGRSCLHPCPPRVELARPTFSGRIGGGTMGWAWQTSPQGLTPVSCAVAAVVPAASPQLSGRAPALPGRRPVARPERTPSLAATTPVERPEPVAPHGEAARIDAHPLRLQTPPVRPGTHFRTVLAGVPREGATLPAAPQPPRPVAPTPRAEAVRVLVPRAAPVLLRTSGLRPRRPRVRFDEEPPVAGPRAVTIGSAGMPLRVQPVQPAALGGAVPGIRRLVAELAVHAVEQPPLAGTCLPPAQRALSLQSPWRQTAPVPVTPGGQPRRPRLATGRDTRLETAVLVALGASPVAGSRVPMQPAKAPLPAHPATRQPHPAPAHPRQAPGVAPVMALAAGPVFVDGAPRPAGEAAIAGRIDCTRPGGQGIAAVSLAPAVAAGVRLAQPMVGTAVHAPYPIDAWPIACAGQHCLAAAPLTPRRRAWEPVQPGSLLAPGMVRGQALPVRPATPPAAAVLRQSTGLVAFPPLPGLRDAWAPVAHPAERLFPIPGSFFRPLAQPLVPLAELVPVDLPLETRRVVRGIRLRRPQDLDTAEGLTGWQRLSLSVNTRWRGLPAAPKWGAAATVLLLAGFASLPGEGTSTAALSKGWLDTPPFIANRAAVHFADDFRGGLSHWQGSGDWSRSWTFDRAGFLQTGPLALFRPSANLVDYEFEFLGQIQRKGMGWVVRARDLNNYQALKLVMVSGGGVPVVALIRYPVVNGRQGQVTERRVPLDLRQDTVYNVTTKVSGSDFTVTIQGQLADYWSEPALSSGGVGLFSSKGEQARIRWIEVRHQNDVLGKLCALLAPPAQMGANQR